ncbi:MAG: hypothetical protein NVS3B14_22960 [Ktedonobacteraceae bacterium]
MLFVSHDTIFDTSSFPYHIYIDSGLVVESNLPTTGTPTPHDTPEQVGNGTYHLPEADPSTGKQEVVPLETVSNMP